KGISRLVNESVKYGIGTLCCLEGYDDAVNDLPMALATTFMPRLPIRMRLFQQYSNIERAKKNFPLLRKKRIGGCGTWEMDGSVGSRSAAFDIPYLGEPKTCGKLYYSDKDRDEMFLKPANEGVTISTHAIGTLAIEKALDSFEKVTPSGNPLRNRLDHTEFPYAKDVERIIKLNLDVTVQPGYAYLDAKYFHSYDSFIEKEVFDRELPLKTLVDGGVNVLGSSDCPVQSLNPFVQMKGMIDCVNESERLTKLQALKTYTVFPSNSLGENNESGSLEVGKNADFGIYRDDYFETAVDKIEDITCEDLYLCGKIVKPMSGGMFEMIKVLLRHKKLI
ncbi:MAG: amidohydrolase family protein, partial [Clostridia bacterium]